VWDSDWEHPDDQGDEDARAGDVVVLEPLSVRVYVSPTPPR
jgi:isoamylase